MNASGMRTNAAAPCVHHWDIATPAGPTSEGVCRKCRETREFPNVPSWMQEKQDYMMPRVISEAARAEYLRLATHYKGWDVATVRGIAAQKRDEKKRAMTTTVGRLRRQG